MKECSYGVNGGHKKDFNSLQKMAKKVLEIYRPLKAHIKVIEKQVKLYENDGMKAISFDGIHSSPTNDVKSMVENIAIKNIEEVEKMQKEKETIQAILSTIEIAVNSLRDEEKRIIELYYFENKRLRFWQIGMVVHRSEFTIMNKLHPYALKQIGLALKSFSGDIEKIGEF